MYLAALDLFWRYELPKNQNTTKKKENTNSCAIRWEFIHICLRNQNGVSRFSSNMYFISPLALVIYETKCEIHPSESSPATVARVTDIVGATVAHTAKMPSRTESNKSRPKLKGDRKEGYFAL